MRKRIRRQGRKFRQGARLRRSAAPGTQAVRAEARARAAPEAEVMIGGAHAPAEKTADRMAAQALAGGPVSHTASSASPGIQRACEGCEKEGEIKRAPAAPGPIAPTSKSAPAPKSATQAIATMGSGRPMNRAERAFFEPRFGRDFSQVRIHEGAGADRAARVMGARAFTYGDHIAFAGKERTQGGPSLFAHELAHVTQGAGEARRTIRRACSNCPTPPNPDVQLNFIPRIRNGAPAGSPFGSTNWGTASVPSVSVLQRERNTCTKCNHNGQQVDTWDICPRRVALEARVDIVIDRAEITRSQGNQDWFTECAAPQGADRFLTPAQAGAQLNDPKRKTVAGVIAHERYHVEVSERLLRQRIRARNDTSQICPYDPAAIAQWKTNVETAIQTDAEAFLRGNPNEPNEEVNASVRECSVY